MKHAILCSSFALLGCATIIEPEPDAPSQTEVVEQTNPTENGGIQSVIPMPSVPLDMTMTLTRIGFGSCASQEEDQAIWDSVTTSNPELFLYIGDNVYGDVWSRDPNMPELREAYALLAQSAPFARLRKSTPVWPMWDDHDYGQNDQGGTYDFKYGGEALFEEAWALPANDPRRKRDGVYHAEVVGKPGQRVQIILLDTRFFRSDLKPTDEQNAPGKERYLPDPDPAKTMLGEAQYAWFAQQLEKPAEIRLIVSSVQVIAEGHGWEAWKTLPTDRKKFYNVIEQSGAERVVLLSGDRHAAALYRHDDALSYPLYEITSSSLNLPASRWRNESGETRVEDGPRRLGTMEYDVNFGMIEIDWESEKIDLILHGEDGGVLQSQSIAFGELER